MWKIIFSDIDGTLLDQHRAISPETAKAYDSIRQHTDFVLISSRMPKGMIYFQDDLDVKEAPLVCYNGGLILRNGLGDYMDKSNILLDVSIPSVIVSQLNEYLRGKEINYSVYSYDDWYSTKRDYWTEREENNTRTTAKIVTPDFLASTEINAHKVMIMGEKKEVDNAYKFITELFPSLELYRSKDTYIEIANKQISKGLAVDYLMEHHFKGVERKKTIAFGDNYNDIPLFKSVGYAVAVDNGREELKELADHICPGNKAHGVASFIKNNFTNSGDEN